MNDLDKESMRELMYGFIIRYARERDRSLIDAYTHIETYCNNHLDMIVFPSYAAFKQFRFRRNSLPNVTISDEIRDEMASLENSMPYSEGASLNTFGFAPTDKAYEDKVLETEEYLFVKSVIDLVSKHIPDKSKIPTIKEIRSAARINSKRNAPKVCS